MSLAILTPPLSHDLVSLEDVKAQLGILDNLGDANLAAWIRQASAAVESYCNRVYRKSTVVQTVRTSGCTGAGIILDRHNVTEIVSVSEAGVALVAADYELEGAILYRLRSDARSYWGYGKIVVTYTAGFEVGDIPGHVQRATIITVSQYLLGTGNDPQIRSETVDGIGSQSFFDGLDESGLPPEARGLLERECTPIIG